MLTKHTNSAIVFWLQNRGLSDHVLTSELHEYVGFSTVPSFNFVHVSFIISWRNIHQCHYHNWESIVTVVISWLSSHHNVTSNAYDNQLPQSHNVIEYCSQDYHDHFHSAYLWFTDLIIAIVRPYCLPTLEGLGWYPGFGQSQQAKAAVSSALHPDWPTRLN